ncbi:Dcm Site-specific DNA methylase [uncultured Caudovirales phage]|uniref:Dcm Site-specific DNA methylase n=1 Tax=uncultured Caudovirales phage TaxID=2100421 RepID=A0A6J5N2T9_9CAUD|nr:Dcm Site-specific DNA methylase [uncultured Caudovirales phage]
MTHTAIDCQSFAGGFALGVVKAGFELIAKREQPGGFGVPAMEANRHLLGDKWQVEACSANQWTPMPADLVFGNPPCSGFSNRSSMIRGRKEDGSIGKIQFKGVNSVANECMWDLVEFAAKCDPKIVIFESVQGAYRKGQDLMQNLRQDLESRTDQEWTLYHVLHNVADLGGAQVRPRYFWVASRIPFGVTVPDFRPETTVADRISDLEDKPLGSVDGHEIQLSPQAARIMELAGIAEWLPDETSGHAYERAVREGIELSNWSEPLVSDKGTTQFAPRRLNYTKPSRVLAGDAPQKVVHPTLPRTVTPREIARLSGFPDDWTCDPYLEKRANSYWWGKGICVEAGQWIAQAAYDAIAGRPQLYSGNQVGEREYLIDAQVKTQVQDLGLF